MNSVKRHLKNALLAAALLQAAWVQAACYPLYGGVNLILANGESGMRMNGLVVQDVGGPNRAVSSSAAVDTVYPTLGLLPSFPVYCASGCPDRDSNSVPPGDYNTVTVSRPTTFDGGTYRINNLVIQNNKTGRFNAGDYYIKNFSIGNGATITILSGPVIFHIGTAMSSGNNYAINRGGTPDNLRVLVYPGASANIGGQDSADTQIDLTAIFYAPSSNTQLSFGNNVDFIGAMIGAGTVSFGNGDFLSDVATEPVLQGLGACIGQPPPSAPGGFNAVDAWDVPQPQSASAGKLYTKIAGVPFDIDVIAFKSNGTEIDTQFNGDVTVELLDAHDNSGALDGTTRCRSSWSSFQSAVLTIVQSDNGRKQMSLTQANAWKEVRVRMTHVRGSNTTIACATDNFAIRPASFNNLTANLGGPTLRAGHDFTLTATASVGAGYNGTPSVNPSLVQDHNSATIAAGALAGSFPVGNGTTATGTFQYHDVGTIRFLVDGIYDDNFTAVDQLSVPNPSPLPPDDCVRGSSSNTLNSTGQYGCTIGLAALMGPFGRFYPDHFALAAALTPACAVGGFTYMDDPHLGIALTLSAQSLADVVCTRYTNGYGYLGSFGIDGDNNGTPVTIAGRFNPALPAFQWSQGVYAVSGSTFQFKRNTVPDGPYDLFALKASILSEPDGVTFVGGSSSAFSTVSKLRFGRLRMSNTNGAAVLALPVPTAAQYWDGLGFATNALDGCSVLPLPTLTFYGQTSDNQLASGETTASYANSPLLAGVSGLQLSAPGIDNYGYVDVGVDLAPLPWLRYNWDGVDQGTDGYLLDDNPQSRATFGRRTALERIIIRRERY